MELSNHGGRFHIMKVAIDAFPLTGRIAGIGRYVHEMCRALEESMPDADFLLYSPKSLSVDPPSNRWQLRIGGSLSTGSYGWLKTSARTMAQDDGAQVFWATRTILPGCTDAFRTVSTVHDLNYRIFPKSMPHATLWAHRLWFARDLRRADKVVTNSQGTADRLRAMLGVGTDAVLHPGVKPPFGLQNPQAIKERLSTLGVQSPYFLSVGTLEPRKNLPALIEAFISLKRIGELRGYQLLISGGHGWRGKRLHTLLREAEHHDVRWMGFVPDEDLAALYAGSRAFVFPSLYEGFGIPAAEARACGARMVVSNLPELHEASGVEAIYISPTVEGISEGLLRAIGLQDTSLPLSAEARPSWNDAALKMADIFRRLG